MSDELVTIGRVVKPHGIRGELAVDVLTDIDGRFDAGVDVVVAGRPRRIAASRPHQGRVLLRFAGIDDRSDAEQLRGSLVQAVPLDTADTDRFFVHELVDAAVVDAAGTPLGAVTAVIELPAAAGYDLLEVRRDDGTTWFLPAVDEYVEALVDDGEVSLRVVDPPEGLLDGGSSA